MRTTTTFLAALLINCGWAMYDGYTLERMSPSTARAADCEFNITSAPVGQGYKEIGALSLKNGLNGNIPTAIAEFKKDV